MTSTTSNTTHHLQIDHLQIAHLQMIHKSFPLDDVDCSGEYSPDLHDLARVVGWEPERRRDVQ